MVSDPHGYTPAQYLEAGYRAEQSSDRDRAAQYYHYVAEAFPETPEGEAARGGLMRIGAAERPHDAADGAAAAAAQTGTWAHHNARTGEATQPQQAFGATAQRVPNGTAPAQQFQPQQIGQSPRPAGASPQGLQGLQGPQGPQGFVPPGPQGGNTGSPAGGAGQRIVLGDLARLKLAPNSPPAPPAAHATEADAGHAGHGDSMRLPEVVARRARELAEADAYTPRPKYRGGRLMARIFVWIGWLIVAGGLASIVVGLLAMPAALAQTGAGMAVVLIAGSVTMVAGLLIVLVGQLALAVFDGSNALREITAFMRARQEL